MIVILVMATTVNTKAAPIEAKLRKPKVLARADGPYGKLMQTLARTDLLILDDWGLAPLGDRERCDLHDEAVPADEKLMSLFEAHADVLVKDRRTTYHDHKIFLTTGGSGLILDCAIPKGNPGDVTWTVPLLRRQQRLFGRAPQQPTFDGAFASQANLAAARALGVADVCLAKKRGLAVRDMVRSQWVYDKLRRFRAGIEAGISLLKRVFGLARCVWKGATGFHAYVRTAVLTANLLLLARARLA